MTGTQVNMNSSLEAEGHEQFKEQLVGEVGVQYCCVFSFFTKLCNALLRNCP